MSDWLFCDPMDCSPPGSSVHGISREYWSGLSFHSPEYLSHPETEPTSPALSHLESQMLTAIIVPFPRFLLSFTLYICPSIWGKQFPLWSLFLRDLRRIFDFWLLGRWNQCFPSSLQAGLETRNLPPHLFSFFFLNDLFPLLDNLLCLWHLYYILWWWWCWFSH